MKYTVKENLLKVLCSLLLLGSFVACSKTKIGQAQGTEEKNLLPAGTELSAAVVIEGKEFAKTSEVVVIDENIVIVGQPGDKSETFLPGRIVMIAPFAIGRYEVTQELYEAIMGNNPSGNLATTRAVEAGELEHLRPVETVSWYESLLFCNLLTMATLGQENCVYYRDKEFRRVYTKEDAKLKKLPYMNLEKKGYRLPLEVEWELAARGGNPDDAANWTLEYAGSNVIEEVTWYNAISLSKSHEVGVKAPNSLNLYDMSGNVWEWCWDWFGTLKVETPVTGLVEHSSSGAYRVYRGGSWGRSLPYCTVYTRSGIVPEYDGKILGFRIARSL